MPLYKEWKIGDHALAAIWKIEEPEEFFAAETGVLTNIKHLQRRTEHLAGRFLLRHLKYDFPLMQITKDEHDKPRIGSNQYYFSISHSWPYVAAIIDPYEEAGIDIQTWHPRIGKIKHKFLSELEQQMFTDDALLAVAWTAKEAAYKWNGRRGLDFIEHLPIQDFARKNDTNELVVAIQSAEKATYILIKNIIDIDFACSFVVGNLKNQ